MTSPWVTTSELLQYLRCSRATLWRNMDRLSYGVHYRRTNPSAKTSPFLWRLDRVEDVFCKTSARSR